MLLGIWGVGSAIGGIWFGTRRPAMALPRQFAWLLSAVAASFLVLAVMPTPSSLGIALVIGGATIAPALTVETTLVGRIAPAAMLNEAYTWVVTVSVAGSAAGGAVAGTIVDQPGGLPWAFVVRIRRARGRRAGGCDPGRTGGPGRSARGRPAASSRARCRIGVRIPAVPRSTPCP